MQLCVPGRRRQKSWIQHIVLILTLGSGALVAHTAGAQDRVYLPFDLSKPATFAGGFRELNRAFKENIRYPKVPGQPTGNRLIIAFVIEKDGTIKRANTHLFETPGEAFTESVLSFLETTKWVPAEASGYARRYLMACIFFFHHPSGSVAWHETAVHVDSYEQLLAVPPEAYSKIAFPTKPIFMPISPEDSLDFEQRYPEAARLAGVQGEVQVEFRISKHGTVDSLYLTHDIGYGCGEEALRRAKFYRSWVPAQIFDSVFDARFQMIFSFCPEPERLRASEKIYPEAALWSAKVNNYYNSRERLYPGDALPATLPLADYNGAVVEVAFTITKKGFKDSITILNSPDARYSRVVRELLTRDKSYEGPNCCRVPMNVRFHRYVSFWHDQKMPEKYSKFAMITKDDPAGIPNLFPPENDTIYAPSMVDQPAYYIVPGEKGIEHFLTLRWPNRKLELGPDGSILLKVFIEKNGAVRDPEVLQGIDAQLDNKAVSFAERMGFWKPAYKNGLPVRSWQTLRFR